MMSGKLYGCVLTTVWLLAMVAISGAQRVDDILQGPDNSLCFVGTSAIFTCVSSLGNCVNMTWHQEDQFSITDWSQIHPSATNRFKMENSTLGCKLTLTNLQRADSGKFKCVYKNSAKAAVLRVFDVTRTPLRGPENKFGYLDSNVDFICVSPVKSCLGMKWHQNRAGPEGETIICNSSTGHCDTDKHIVTRSAGGCKLIVQRLEYRDAGAVICEVWISQRLYRRTAALLVFNTTENPLTEPTNSLAYVGANATLTCVSPLGSCADMIWYRYTIRSGYASWYQLNYAVPPRPTQKYIVENIPSRCKLTVTNVIMTDSGPYQCRFMTHFEATAQLYAIDRRQQEKPLTGMSDGAGLVGSNITFICISPLKNCLEMIWSKHINSELTVEIFNAYNGIYRRDKYIVENSTVGCQLTVKHIELNDTANYTCKIKISDRVYPESAQLYAFGADVNPLKKLVNSLTFADTDAVFTCVSPLRNCVNITWFHYSGIPSVPRKSWYKIRPKLHPRSYKEENVNFGCKLTVKNVTAIQAGRYKCEFLHTFERTAELILIDLHYQNVSPLTGPADVYSYLGLNVTFACDSPLGNCDSMNWYKSKNGTNRTTIYSGDNGIYLRHKYVVENFTVGCGLTVMNVNLNDASRVICEIIISQRSYEGTAELFVLNTTENPLEEPKNSLTFIGANATFICASPLRNCDNMTWYKYNISWHPVLQLNGQQPRVKYVVETIHWGCKLTVTAVTFEDSGLYKCRFTNYFAATAQLFAIDAKHQEKPLTVLSDGIAYVGSNFSFTCVSPLKNCVELFWYKYIRGKEDTLIFSRYDGIYLSDKYIVDNSTMGCELTIKRVELSDAAVYFCEIQISPKFYDGNVTLYTFNPVDNVDLPLKRPASLSNFIGTNATFKCVSPLKSCVNMTWQRGLGRSGLQINYTAYPSFRDKYIMENFPLGCQLTVANVQLTDATTYQCIFMKSITRTADLFAINRTRGNPLRGPKDLAVFVGFDANFTCTTPLRNCTLLNWYKHKRGPDRLTIYDLEKGIYLRDKYVVESVSRRCQLTIKNVERNDNSSYFCELVISQRSYQTETKVSVNVSGEPNRGRDYNESVCTRSDTDLAVLSSRHFRYAYVSPVQDAHEETVYHFPLSIVNRTFLNATIHAPFSMVTSGNLDQTDLPSLNVTISARVPEVIEIAQKIHSMSSGQTDFCHQETLTEIVLYMLEIGVYNLTVDVLASCHFRSGSPPQGTVCSVNRPGKPFLQLGLSESTVDVDETTTTTTTTTTTEPSTSSETQRVIGGLCTLITIGSANLAARPFVDPYTHFEYYETVEGDPGTNSATYLFSHNLKYEDRILNATIYTPISITAPGNLSQPDLPPLNITISVRDSDTQVQFTTVYNSSFAGTEFCHQGTLTEALQGMLGTDWRNITVDVTTSCQFRSVAQQGMDCSVDHPGNPFLAIYFRSKTPIPYPTFHPL